jgi:hypothetical protein
MSQLSDMQRERSVTRKTCSALTCLSATEIAHRVVAGDLSSREVVEAHNEQGLMAHLLMVCPLRPGTQERWRRLYQELAGLRQEQFEVFCRQAGISQVQVWLVQPGYTCHPFVERV